MYQNLCKQMVQLMHKKSYFYKLLYKLTDKTKNWPDTKIN